jgi:hypothetical protein
MIRASVHVPGKGHLPMALDHPWRAGDLVCFVKDGPEYTVESVSWNHYQPRNHDCHIELAPPVAE